jgi:hypothetical protein
MYFARFEHYLDRVPQGFAVIVPFLATNRNIRRGEELAWRYPWDV